jgi:hypothetical protein
MVQLVEMSLQKFSPILYNALGIYLPLITTNCAVLGATILSIENKYNLIEAITFAASAAIGFLATAAARLSGCAEHARRRNATGEGQYQAGAGPSHAGKKAPAIDAVVAWPVNDVIRPVLIGGHCSS